MSLSVQFHVHIRYAVCKNKRSTVCPLHTVKNKRRTIVSAQQWVQVESGSVSHKFILLFYTHYLRLPDSPRMLMTVNQRVQHIFHAIHRTPSWLEYILKVFGGAWTVLHIVRSNTELAVACVSPAVYAYIHVALYVNMYACVWLRVRPSVRCPPARSPGETPSRSSQRQGSCCSSRSASLSSTRSTSKSPARYTPPHTHTYINTTHTECRAVALVTVSPSLIWSRSSGDRLGYKWGSSAMSYNNPH